MNLDVEKAEKSPGVCKGYAKGYITEMECNEMTNYHIASYFGITKK